MKDILATVGKVAFVVGVLFAIFGGIWGGKAAPTNHAVIAVLLIAGVLIGFLNITAKETWVVLMATVVISRVGGKPDRCTRRLRPAHGPGSNHHCRQGGHCHSQARRLIPFWGHSTYRQYVAGQG